MIKKYISEIWASVSLIVLITIGVLQWDSTQFTTQLLQQIAGVAGILCSYYILKEKQITWFFNILNCIIWAYLSFIFHMFYDSAMQLFFIVMGLLSYFKWKKIEPGFKLKKQNWVLIIAASLILTIIGYYIKDSSPLLDSTNALIGLVAAFTLLEKNKATFYLWIIGDVIMTIAYISQPVMAIIYVIYLSNALIGLYVNRTVQKED